MDLSFLEKFTKGDPKKMKRYITLYLDVAPKSFEEMQRNLEAEDWEQLRINAHSLKPQADFMGLAELKANLVQIEEAVKSNKLDNIHQLFEVSVQLSVASVEDLQTSLQEL